MAEIASMNHRVSTPSTTTPAVPKRRIDYYQNPQTFVLDPSKRGPAPYGMREDGTPKGEGFFGKIPRTDDPKMVSTELSASTDFKVNGRTVLFPLIVPTLTKEQLDYLVSTTGPPNRDDPKAVAMEQEIVQKAEAHARERIAKGKSPFAESNERHPLPVTEEEAMQQGFQSESQKP